MRKGMRKKSFLLCFLLVITMVFSGCQSSPAPLKRLSVPDLPLRLPEPQKTGSRKIP